MNQREKENWKWNCLNTGRGGKTRKNVIEKSVTQIKKQKKFIENNRMYWISILLFYVTSRELESIVCFLRCLIKCNQYKSEGWRSNTFWSGIEQNLSWNKNKKIIFQQMFIYNWRIKSFSFRSNRKNKIVETQTFWRQINRKLYVSTISNHIFNRKSFSVLCLNITSFAIGWR